MHIGVKYRLYPTAAQREVFARHFGCARYVYNRALELKVSSWADNRVYVSCFELSAMLPVWKKEEHTKWLKDAFSQSLQRAIKNLEAAFTAFERGLGGFPKFKKRGNRDSLYVGQGIALSDNSVELPKIGCVAARIHRRIQGRIICATASKTLSGKYFLSITYETAQDLPTKPPVVVERTVGIDLGLTHFATLSTGEKIANPRHLKRKLRQLKRAQRQLSRKARGSKNRNKQRVKVAIIHEKVANCRKDFLHKVTSRLVRDNQVDTYAIEDLAVQNMTQNRRLSRAISDVGWSAFRSLIQYKADWYGKNLLVIGRFEASSKTCSCGVANRALTLADRTWTCGSCGTTHDRDILAANNIKRFALRDAIGQEVPEFTLGETSSVGVVEPRTDVVRLNN